VAILIDGYNLISTAGILGRGAGPGALARARLALLNFLAESLDAKELAGTTVVFDAAGAPPGLPRHVAHRGIAVRFAARYPDADSLIEKLIDEHSAPRRLLVVSSDHRLQRAARRRRARAIDAELWYDEIVRRQQRRERRDRRGQGKPPVPLLAEAVDYWVRQFGGESTLGQWVAKEWGQQDAHNPFPPGYADEIEEP